MIQDDVLEFLDNNKKVNGKLLYKELTNGSEQGIRGLRHVVRGMIRRNLIKYKTKSDILDFNNKNSNKIWR